MGRQTNGKLVYIKNGKEVVLESNLPFAMLNSIKTKLVRNRIYSSNELKLKYL